MLAKKVAFLTKNAELQDAALGEAMHQAAASKREAMRSDAAGIGAERGDAVRRIRSGAMRQRVASTNAIQKCLLIQQTSHYLRHFQA